MSDGFDPYHVWLGIPPKHQPANHYRLLGIELFEDNPEVIRDAGEQRMAHVRTYHLGKYSALSQKILNELAAAKVCLQDAEKKAAYDAFLQAEMSNSARPAGASPRQPTYAVAAPRSVPPPVSLPLAIPVDEPAATRSEAPAAAAGSARPARSVGRALGWPLRRGDRLLAALAGGENTLLHGVFRAAGAVVLLLVFATALWLWRAPLKIAAVYHIEIDPAEAKLAVTGMGAGMEGNGHWRTVTVPKPDGHGEIVLRAALADYENLEQTLTPRPGSSETVVLRLRLLNERKPLRLRAVAPQTVEVGKPLTVAILVENAAGWQGKLRFALGPDAPPGGIIDQRTGLFTWMPAETELPGAKTVAVTVEDGNGRRDQTAFSVIVRPRQEPIRFKPIADQTVQAGKALTVDLALENATAGTDPVEFALATGAPPDATIDRQSGKFAWTPAKEQAGASCDVTVSARAPDGRSDQRAFRINVVKPAHDTQITLDLGDGVNLDLVLIPAGDFLMGSPVSDTIAASVEKPQHRVRITKPFYLGKYLVTQEQWQTLMGSNPSHFKAAKNPVETVSWDDCQHFLRQLTEKAGEGEFQLPTEAQFEYACRAGTTTRYCFGDDDSKLSEYAWYKENSDNKTHPVDETKPNAWGLYDMHGNVWEWCADWYGGRNYPASATHDPSGPSSGSERILRGGAWFNKAREARSAVRGRLAPASRNFSSGFRVCRTF